jgi:hypothetical protein
LVGLPALTVAEFKFRERLVVVIKVPLKQQLFSWLGLALYAPAIMKNGILYG